MITADATGDVTDQLTKILHTKILLERNL